MAWLTLMAACVFEIAWAGAMKYSDGFTRLWPTLATLLAALISFGLLAQANRTISLATCYIMLNSIGTVGVVVLGIVFFKESAHPIRFLCIALILVGLVGLRMTTAE
jgi:quaternary ammonium compound-resistance protein SugE